MIWKFIKSNWFSIALVLLLVMAAARRGLRLNLGGAGEAPRPELSQEKPERFTDKAVAETQKPSTLDLGMPGASGVRQALPAIDEAAAVAYLRRFGNVVVGEQKKFHVPASVMLALSYVNSFAGTREAARQANNFFALPCGPDFEGQTAHLEGRCYRQYATAWESFRDFSIYLAGQDWFGAARGSAGRDWKGWVAALGQQQVSDVENFEAEMTRIIQLYRLYELDTR